MFKSCLCCVFREAAGSRLMRVLALLDLLASQRACKAAMLSLLGGSTRSEGRAEGKVEDKQPDLLRSFLAMLIVPADTGLTVQQDAELTASIIQSLCDQDVSLVVSGSGEASVSEAEQLANALPTKEVMACICDGMVEVLGNAHSSYTLQLTCLRTMMFLTEHDYGLYHLKRCVLMFIYVCIHFVFYVVKLTSVFVLQLYEETQLGSFLFDPQGNRLL